MVFCLVSIGQPYLISKRRLEFEKASHDAKWRPRFPVFSCIILLHAEILKSSRNLFVGKCEMKKKQSTKVLHSSRISFKSIYLYDNVQNPIMGITHNLLAVSC